MSYTGKDETPELTYALIQGAVQGDKTALEMVLLHFDAYINAVSTVKKADWVTGTVLALKEKKWNSSRARQRLWNKCGSIITVGVSVLTDILRGLVINNVPGIKLPFEYCSLLCSIVLVWYIVSELGSILENAAHMGTPVPAFLKAVLKKVNQACETEDGK